MDRINKYFLLNNKLSLLDDTHIKSLIYQNSKDIKHKTWGENKIITIDTIKIFSKKIPIPKKLYDNQFNSSNLYNLPAYYNYGNGSAGINCWRELLLHIKTTNFVLHNVLDNFPLLYHYRIIKDNSKNFISGLNIDDMKTWNNDSNIKKYLTDRLHSEYKIILFLEYIPYVSYIYYEVKFSNKFKDYYSQATKIFNFLHKNGIIHNDNHLGNFLVDDKGILYLTDFGLSLDIDFSLKTDEFNIIKYHKFDNVGIKLNILHYFFKSCINNKNVKKLLKNNEKNFLTDFKIVMNNIDEFNKYVKCDSFIINFTKKYKNLCIKYSEWEELLMKNHGTKNIYFKLT
jgi:hypothetical protein